MDAFTVSFFGHRRINNPFVIENKLERLIIDFLIKEDYVEFLVGRNGEFDQLVSSVIHRSKKNIRNDNSALILVLPYLTAEYRENRTYFHQYYDEVEICLNSAGCHYKSAFQTRNRSMVDHSDFSIFYVDHCFGGAYQTMMYAKKRKAKYINLWEIK